MVITIFLYRLRISEKTGLKVDIADISSSNIDKNTTNIKLDNLLILCCSLVIFQGARDCGCWDEHWLYLHTEMNTLYLHTEMNTGTTFTLRRTLAPPSHWDEHYLHTEMNIGTTSHWDAQQLQAQPPASFFPCSQCGHGATAAATICSQQQPPCEVHFQLHCVSLPSCLVIISHQLQCDKI